MTPEWLRYAIGRSGNFFFSSRRRHTRFDCDWSSDVCSSDLADQIQQCVNVLHLFEHLWREPAGMADTQDALVETGAALTPKQHERILRELLQRYAVGRGQWMGFRQSGKQWQLHDGLASQKRGLEVGYHETNIGVALLDRHDRIADRRLE